MLYWDTKRYLGNVIGTPLVGIDIIHSKLPISSV